MQRTQPAKIEDDGRFLFSRRLRRILLYVGLFVLYSQLVSAGLTGVYRYSPSELSFLDGGHPDIFEPWTFTLLQPPEAIGTIDDLQAIGWRIGYQPIRYALWSIALPTLGAAALLFARVARHGWLAHLLLGLGSCLGIAAAVIIKMYEFAAGSIGWAWDHQTLTNATLPNPPHPIYGYLELFGGFFLPIVVYATIVLFVVASAGWRLIRTIGGAPSNSQRPGNQRR